MSAVSRDATVSVALCTHNGARYIEAQVRSILEQSLPVQQIVVSDDASTDDTVAIVERLVAESSAPPKLTVLRNATALGVTGNFQQAADACTGDFIVLCDQDDVWRSDRVAVAVDLMLSEPALLLTHSDARLVDGDGAPLGLTLFQALEIGGAIDEIHAGRAFTALLRRNLATGATMMLRRELLAQVEPLPREWLHDEWLAITAAILGRIDVIELPLIDYRQHGANVVGAARPSLRTKVRRVLAPRGQRSEGLVGRAAALLRWVEARDDLDPVYFRETQQKFLHERYRMDLPPVRLGRLLPVLRELRRRGYARYAGRGRFDVLRDVLQPH